MSIITISRGCYSRGKEIAEIIAESLDYECISRDIILEASEEFNVPEIKLVRAIHDAPSIFDRLSLKKERYVAEICTALLQHFLKDNIVYHGLAGHFFVRGISHVLKVRITSDMEDRAKLEMEREGISKDKAISILKKDDEERRRWSHSLYGIDTTDSSLYDLAIRIHKISVDDAVAMICDAVSLNTFKTTPESQTALENLALSAEVRAVLLDAKLDTEVTAEDGVVAVRVKAPIAHHARLIREIEKHVKGLSGVKQVRADVIPTDY